VVVGRHLTKFGNGAVASGQIEAFKLNIFSHEICSKFYIYLFLLTIYQFKPGSFQLAHYMH
jgi:hypothetical protein